MDIWERIRYARDRALEAEEVERQRLAEADTTELQSAASVRLATRQAVREALDDVLDESSSPAKGSATGGASTDPTPAGDAGTDVAPEADPDSAAVDGPEAEQTSEAAESSYAGAGTPPGDVQQDPGSQVDG